MIGKFAGASLRNQEGSVYPRVPDGLLAEKPHCLSSLSGYLSIAVAVSTTIQSKRIRACAEV